MKTKLKKRMTYVVVVAFLIALLLNVKTSLDKPGLDFGSLVAFASENAPPDGPRSKDCREVGCNGVWEGSADVNGCIRLFGKKICGFEAGLTVRYPYSGKKENCTGGDKWYDCDACQKDCVKTETNS